MPLERTPIWVRLVQVILVALAAAVALPLLVLAGGSVMVYSASPVLRLLGDPVHPASCYQSDQWAAELPLMYGWLLPFILFVISVFVPAVRALYRRRPLITSGVLYIACLAASLGMYLHETIPACPGV